MLRNYRRQELRFSTPEKRAALLNMKSARYFAPSFPQSTVCLLVSLFTTQTRVLAFHHSLNVIIYDAMRSGPVTSLETCDVFPLEAVYGYVEVKATLQSSSDEAKEPTDNSIEKCLLKNRDLRAMKDRRYWTPMFGSSVKAGLIKQEWISVRSYVFAFEPLGNIANDLGALAQRIANISKRQGPPTHLHGVFIADHGYLYTRPVEAHRATPEDYYHVGFTRDHALLAFKTQLLQDLARYPRPPEQWSPAIEQYFQQEPTWTFRQPEI